MKIAENCPIVGKIPSHGAFLLFEPYFLSNCGSSLYKFFHILLLI